MTTVPPDLLARLSAHGQDHAVAGWAALPPADRAALAAQLAGIDFAGLAALYARRDEPAAVLPPRDRIAPPAVEDRASIPPDVVRRGEDAIRRGEVAVLLVAGGQGSRLGSDRPKGEYPVGPVTGASLFQTHAEKVLALRRRYAARVPFLVMTSPATHADTVAFFRDHAFLGLPADDVHFFQQGTMPALDIASGRLILEAPGRVFLGPNGHGGTLTALADTGLLATLKAGGVRHVFYFQVDNPLVRVADPAFVGRHVAADAEVSSKVVFKAHPGEKVGVLADIGGRCGIIEYSDLPDDMAEARDERGELLYRAGSPAIHLFSVAFLEKVTSGDTRLAYHVARKKVPGLDAAGNPFTPEAENALKFEMFVFDALPLAERWAAVSVRREDEFAPLKNATGADSPESCRRLQINLAARWLEAAGAVVPRGADGEPAFPVEVGPLFALDETEVAGKIPAGTTITGPTAFR